MERVPYSYTLNDFPKSSERITSVLRHCVEKDFSDAKTGYQNKYLEVYIAVPSPFQFS